METDYFIIDKASTSLIILSISLIKSRLDISLLSATTQKPVLSKAPAALPPSSSRGTCRRTRSAAGFRLLSPPKDQAERSPPMPKAPAGEVRINPPCIFLLTPNPLGSKLFKINDLHDKMVTMNCRCRAFSPNY